MNEYLVIQDRRFKSIKTWPELQTMLLKAEQEGIKSIRIYRLDKIDPERVWPVKVKDSYMLYDIYMNVVEG